MTTEPERRPIIEPTTRTLRLVIEVSVPSKADDLAVADRLFDWLVDRDDIPVASVDNVEIAR